MTRPMIPPLTGPGAGVPFPIQPPYGIPPFFGWPLPPPPWNGWTPWRPGATPGATRAVVPDAGNDTAPPAAPALTRADGAVLAHVLETLRAARAAADDPDAGQPAVDAARRQLRLVVGYVVGFLDAKGFPTAGAGLDELVPATRPSPGAALDELEGLLVRLTAPGTRGLFDGILAATGYGGLADVARRVLGALGGVH